MPEISGETLRVWRRSRGWDVPETARQLRTAAGNDPIPAHDALVRMIYRWERLDLKTERYELLYRKLGAGTANADAAESQVSAADDTTGLTDELADHALELGRWAEATNIGAATTDILADEIRRIAHDYCVFPPEILIRAAADVSKRVFGLLQEHQRLQQTRDLYVIGAQSCAFLACALGDLGERTAAAANARTALVLAEEADHPAASALAFSALSKVAFWDGRRNRARDLARKGYELCPPDSTRVLLACQEADAAEIPAAREAISRAWRTQDEISAEEDLAGLFTCGRARVACYTMTLHLRAGDPAGVLAAAADADAAYRDGEELFYGTWGQVQISAALAHLISGEPDGAADRLGAVLALPAGLRFATFRGKLGQVAALASTPGYRGSAAALELAGQVRGYLGDVSEDDLRYPLALSAGRRDL